MCQSQKPRGVYSGKFYCLALPKDLTVMENRQEIVMSSDKRVATTLQGNGVIRKHMQDFDSACPMMD